MTPRCGSSGLARTANLACEPSRRAQGQGRTGSGAGPESGSGAVDGWRVSDRESSCQSFRRRVAKLMTRKTWLKNLLLAVVVIGIAIRWTFFRPAESAPPVDGKYRSDCCGTITQEKGNIKSTHGQIRYVLQEDKVGLFILPSRLVEIRDGEVAIDWQKGPLIIRVDTSSSPTKIAISSEPDSHEILFEAVRP